MNFEIFVYKFWSPHLALSDKTNRMKISQEMREKKQFFVYVWNKICINYHN